MTKLVFHLGDMKAGSTSIQHALSSKLWSCDKVKMTYPHGGRVSHLALARSIGSRPDPKLTIRLMVEMVDEIEANPADIAVISSEDFEDVDPVALKALIQSYMPEKLADARFISYVRPHADRIASNYAERVKAGHTRGSMAAMQQTMFERGAYFYAPRFKSWRAVFGSAFEVRPMIRDLLYRQDVVADFLKFALQTEDFTLQAAPDANTALSLENLSIVRQLHMRLSGGKMRTFAFQPAVGRALARRMNESAFARGTKVQYDRALAETIRNQYSADAQELDAAFFQGTPMMDALNASLGKAVEHPQSILIEDHFSDREQYLINLWVDQTAALLKSDPDRWAAILRQQHMRSVTADGEPPARAPAKGPKKSPGDKKPGRRLP